MPRKAACARTAAGPLLRGSASTIARRRLRWRESGWGGTARVSLLRRMMNRVCSSSLSLSVSVRRIVCSVGGGTACVGVAGLLCAGGRRAGSAGRGTDERLASSSLTLQRGVYRQRQRRRLGLLSLSLHLDLPSLCALALCLSRSMTLHSPSGVSLSGLPWILATSWALGHVGGGGASPSAAQACTCAAGPAAASHLPPFALRWTSWTNLGDNLNDLVLSYFSRRAGARVRDWIERESL